MLKIIKEIIIMLLICLVTMLILAITLYKYIPSKKVVPEIIEYVATEDIKDLLQDNIDTKSEDDNVILTYEVTSSDLKNYQNTNIYIPGKSNPFAPAATTVDPPDDDGDDDDDDDNNGDEKKTVKDPEVYENKSTK